MSRVSVSWETTLCLSPDSAIELRIVGDFPTVEQLRFLSKFLDLARLQLTLAVEGANAEQTPSESGRA